MSAETQWYSEYDGPKWIIKSAGRVKCGLGFNRKADGPVTGDVQIEAEAETADEAIRAARAEYETVRKLYSL